MPDTTHDPTGALTHELSRHVTALQDAARDLERERTTRHQAEAARDQARRDLTHARAAGDVYRRQYLQACQDLDAIREARAHTCDRHCDEGGCDFDPSAFVDRIDEILSGEPVKSIPIYFDHDPDCGCTPPCGHGTYAAAPVPPARAQVAVAPAVDPAAGADGASGGGRTGGGDHGQQGGAEPATPPTWEYTDPDGDAISIEPVGLGAQHGWRIVVDLSGVDDWVHLTWDAAASLHAWLGQGLGQAGPSTPDGIAGHEWDRLIAAGRAGGEAGADAVCDAHSLGVANGAKVAASTPPPAPDPGPQDIPAAWTLALMRDAHTGVDHPADQLMDCCWTSYHRRALQAAYRTGYAAALGYEITVSDEGDAVYIGECPAPAGAADGGADEHRAARRPGADLP